MWSSKCWPERTGNWLISSLILLYLCFFPVLSSFSDTTQSDVPSSSLRFVGTSRLQTSGLMAAVSTEVFQLDLNRLPQKTAWKQPVSSSKYYFIPSWADTSEVPQSHSSPFSTKPLPHDDGAMMAFISGMLVRHFGMSFNMYFSKSWRLQELNFLGTIELFWESKRTWVMVVVDKEKQ